MFSGIVEATSVCKNTRERPGVLELTLEKPNIFNDLHIGDSIAVDGVCLTLESQAASTMTFALAAETLQVTGWDVNKLVDKPFNLERSLKLDDRIHGHLVTGHVDEMGVVGQIERAGESLMLQVSFSSRMRPYLWSKGSVAVNGVSLTLNKVTESFFEICLIPETLRRTNLQYLTVGQKVTLEADNMARGLVHQHELQRTEEPS